MVRYVCDSIAKCFISKIFSASGYMNAKLCQFLSPGIILYEAYVHCKCKPKKF